MAYGKTKVLRGGSLIALTTMVAALPDAAIAQTPNASDVAYESGDIVVTARRRDESIQTVPIAITALSADDLAERNISNLNDLTNTTPGV